MSDLKVKDARSYSVYGLLVAGSRFTEDYDEDDAVRHYLELHPEADEMTVRAALQAEITRREDMRTMPSEADQAVSALIDPITTPYSEPDEIRAEIALIRLMPQCAGRDVTLKTMSEWLERDAGPDASRSRSDS